MNRASKQNKKKTKILAGTAEREETTDACYLGKEIFRGSVNYTKASPCVCMCWFSAILIRPNYAYATN